MSFESRDRLLPRLPAANGTRRRWLVFFSLWLLPSLVTPALAAPLEAVVTQIRPDEGQAWYSRADNANQRVLVVQQNIHQDDLITTGAGTWVQLLFRPACQVWIGPNSKVLVNNLNPELSRVNLHVLLGQVRATLGSLLGFSAQDFTLTAETVYAAPRGTDFLVRRDAGGKIEVTVFEGQVEVGKFGEVGRLVDTGMEARASGGGAIGAPQLLPNDELERRRRMSAPSIAEQGLGLQLEIPSDDLNPRTPRAEAVEADPFSHERGATLDPPVVAPNGPWKVGLEGPH